MLARRSCPRSKRQDGNDQCLCPPVKPTVASISGAGALPESNDSTHASTLKGHAMKHRPQLGQVLLTLAALAFGCSAAWAQAAFDIVPVARLGDPVVAPATLVSASDPMLSDTGSVLFRGDGGLILTSPEG